MKRRNLISLVISLYLVGLYLITMSVTLSQIQPKPMPLVHDCWQGPPAGHPKDCYQRGPL